MYTRISPSNNNIYFGRSTLVVYNCLGKHKIENELSLEIYGSQRLIPLLVEFDFEHGEEKVVGAEGRGRYYPIMHHDCSTLYLCCDWTNSFHGQTK